MAGHHRHLQGELSAFDLQAQFAKTGVQIETNELKRWNDNINAVTRIKDREFPEQTIPIKARVP